MSTATDKSEKEQMSVKEVMSEIETLRSLHHEAILHLKEYFVDYTLRHVYVLTEMLYGGAVLDAILKMKDERYTEAEAKVVVQRTLEGIEYMHSNLVIHRDLKLENLLLKRTNDLTSVVIADFGLAKRCRQIGKKKREKKRRQALPHAAGVDDSAVGTPVYAAPEVVGGKSYGASVDMWSLGVICYVLVTGAMPRDLWKSAIKHGRVTTADFGFDCYEWDTVSTQAREFIQGCLTCKPEKRLSANAALSHAWMKHVPKVRPEPLRIKSKLRDFAKGRRLPTRRYEPGEYLIKQGQRAGKEVYLIKSGTVNIIVRDKESGEDVKVATRTTGEFVGEMSVGASVLSAMRAPKEDEKEEPKKFGSKAMSKLGVALKTTMAAKKWVGLRRTADVVADTKVECLVLRKAEMQWAVNHDEKIKMELKQDIHQRRSETEDKLQNVRTMKQRESLESLNLGDVKLDV